MIDASHLCDTRCGRPAPGVTLCDDCVNAVLAALNDICARATDHHDGSPLPNLVDELHITLTRSARTTSGRVGGRSAGTPLPWHEGAGDAVRRLKSALGTWASRLHLMYARAYPDSTDPTGFFVPPPDFIGTLDSLAAWLLRHPDWIRRHPDAADLHADITSAVDDAWRVIDRAPDRWFAGPCSVENCPGFVFGDPEAEDGSCTLCGATYNMVTRRAFLLEAARRYVLTAAELSRAMPVLLGITVSRKTITTWANRGELPVADHDDRRGWPLYRMGDVEALVLQKVDQSGKTG